MRLHRLSLAAFLAFPGEETVDFDRLGEAGLFLLQGRTGAGKTALLDAVCFAFYGEVPGARQESARLRSDHATADVPTEVTVEATLRGRRVRVTRAPEQERPKVRGEGTTTEAHRVRVVAVEADGRETVLATRHDDARAELADLLGMTKEQFCQVVLLPQGGFARFLQARSDEREALLRELFSVGRFAFVEHWLKDRKHDAERTWSSALADVREVVARAEEVASGPGAGRPTAADSASGPGVTSGAQWRGGAEWRGGEPAPEDWMDAADWLDGQLIVAEAQAATAADAFAQAGEHRAAAAAALVAGRELGGLQEAARQAGAALAAWEAGRPQRDEDAAKVAAARRAAPAQAQAVDLDERLAAAATAQREGEAALAAATDAGLVLGPQALPGFDDESRGSVSAPEARAAAGDLRAAAGAAEAMLGRERALDAAERALEQLQSRASGHLEAVRTQEAALAAADERRPACERAVAEGERAAARLEGVLAAARAARAAADAGAERDDLLRAEGPLRERSLSARETAVGAEEAHAAVLARRLDGIAAELAGRLAEGEACAVCGSTEHPSPAIAPDGGLVGEDVVRSARETADTAVAARETIAAELGRLEQALAAARARVAAAEDGRQWQIVQRQHEQSANAADAATALAPDTAAATTRAASPTADALGDPETHTGRAPGLAAPPPTDPPLADLSARAAAAETSAATRTADALLGDPEPRTGRAPELAAPPPTDPPLADLSARGAAAEATAAETRALADRLPDAERTLAALLRSREETVSRLQAARDASTEAQAQLAERRARIEEERAAVERVRAGEPSITIRMRRLTALADLADRAADGLDAAARHADEARRAADRAVQAARRAGFADLDALRAALLDDDRLAALEAQIQAFDDGLTQRRSATERPELQAAQSQPAPDVATLEQQAAATSAAADQARGALADAERRQDGLRTNRARLDTALKAAAPAKQRLAVVKELADLTAGTSASNRLRMRLSAYVLAARLEEVAAAATVRLQQMSGGRYALEHTDDGAKGRSRGGLDLRVMDAWTGRDRPPSSLSGGETFLASLALALGLADVVTAEAGGATLETLFVDEGFGSLDDEGTLEEVLDVLDGLRDGGRAVGIVSHVPELRTRIPTQLRIEKTRSGSTVVA